MPMKVIYEGTDIYNDVSIASCWHTMNAWAEMDRLTMVFGDTRNLWDTWQPKEDDIIRVEDGSATTGDMFIRSVTPKSSRFELRAFPAPQSMREPRCRSWSKVRLFSLIGQIASENGMSYETYGLENHLYTYIEQANVSDMKFLNDRLTLEGASMILFDRKIIAYGGAWAESQEPVGDPFKIKPGVDYELIDDTQRAWGSCLVTDGNLTGEFSAGDGKQLKRVLSLTISDGGEALRFAQGCLREANREKAMIKIKTDTMLREYAPGSVVNLEASAAASWNGKAVVSMLRHDYYDERSRICLVKRLETY